MRNASKRLLVLVAMLCAGAAAQETPPATQPATTQSTTRPRYQLTVPPGFVLAELAGKKILCEPADRAWVEEAVAGLTPATRPTTMPADVLARLQDQKAALAKRIASDYALADAAPIARHLDRLAEELKRIRDFSPPLFYLVGPQEHVKGLVKSDQWSDPAFHFNRLSDALTFRTTIPLSLERPMDDTLLPCLYQADASPAARQEKLRSLLRSTELQVEQMVSGQAGYVTQMTIVQSIQTEVFDPMKLPIDQGWLGTGLAGVTSAEYASSLIGSSRQQLLLMMAAELRTNPIKMRTIDLLHPAEPLSLKRQYVVAYVDAYRRKSMSAAVALIEKSPEKLPQLLRSMRESPCTSGEELLKRIREVTGVDLTRTVSAE